MTDELSIDSGALIFATLADVYLTSGMIDEAISILKDGLSRNPTYTLAKVILGRAYYMKGDIDEALKILEEVYKNNRDSENTNLYIAHCYRKQGDYDKAIEHYEATLKINPKNLEATQEIESLRPSQPIPAEVSPQEPSVVKSVEEEIPATAGVAEAVPDKEVEIPEEAEVVPAEPTPLPESSAEIVEEEAVHAEEPEVTEAEEAPEEPTVQPDETHPEQPVEEEEKGVVAEGLRDEIDTEQKIEAIAVPIEVDKVGAKEEVVLADVSSTPAAEPAAVPLETLEAPVQRLLKNKTVKGAFISSKDGLLIQNYYRDRPDIEEICALIAAIYSEAEESFRFLKEGDIDKIIIQKDDETICVITAGESLLTVVTQPETKPGLVFVYARKVIDEIREILG